MVLNIFYGKDSECDCNALSNLLSAQHLLDILLQRLFGVCYTLRNAISFSLVTINVKLKIVGENSQPEALNKKALTIVTRVREKLTGRDFAHEESLTVDRQVHLLILQATANENLCQCYIGW